MGKRTGGGRARLPTLREANGFGKEAAKVFLDLEVEVEVEVEALVVPCVSQEGILYRTLRTMGGGDAPGRTAETAKDLRELLETHCGWSALYECHGHSQRRGGPAKLLHW